MNKVLTTTQFILWLQFAKGFTGDFEQTVIRYATLMLQPLELGMFVACVDGKPIPKDWENNKAWQFKKKREEIIQHAKEQVLFEEEFYIRDWEGSVIIKKALCIKVDDGDTEKEICLMWKTWKDNWESSHGDSIEDLVREIDIKPTKAFTDKVGL